MKKNPKPLKLNKETLKNLTLQKGAVLGQAPLPITVWPECDED